MSSILKTLLNGSIAGCRPLFHGFPYPVRQNVSTVVFFGCRAFNSQSPKSPCPVDNSVFVKDLLRDYGFDDTHFSKLDRAYQRIYTLSARKNILPKLEFFKSIGISGSELPKFVVRWPLLLSSSLRGKIIPCYEYLRGIPAREEQFIQMLKYRPGILLTNVKTRLAPNVELLRGMGAPMSSITFLLIRCSPVMGRKHDKFKIFVDQLVAMGLNPLITTFIIGLHVLSAISKDTWEVKVKLYKRFGLSNDEIISAFKKQPLIMALSQKNLLKTLEFLLNEQQLDKLTVVNDPTIILLSLERRIIPRCRVVEMLVKKGLDKKCCHSYFLKMNEKRFLNRYCHRFENELPELIEIYSKGKSPSKESLPVCPD